MIREKFIYDADEDNFKELLLGRRVASIEGEILTLDNGTQIELEDAQDCCAWFEGEVRNVAINYSENIITDISRSDETATDDGFIVHVLSQSEVLFDIAIEGDASNGYYCHSINLLVKGGK